MTDDELAAVIAAANALVHAMPTSVAPPVSAWQLAARVAPTDPNEARHVRTTRSRWNASGRVA